MKKFFLVKIFLVFVLHSLCQDTSKIKTIDSIIARNQENIKAIYQLEKKAVMEVMHERNSIKDVVYVLKYDGGKVPVEVIEISKSGNDTGIIVHNYFNEEKVIKVNCIWKWSYYNTDSIYTSEDIIYVDNGKDIFTFSTDKEHRRYEPETYIYRANEILKRIKRGRLKFPL